jgi:uncharacterized membrane protein YkoI
MFRLVWVVSAAALAVVLAGPADGFAGQKYARDAKIALSEAETIALRSRPGTITDAELERETGGSGLRYSFDIKSAGKTFEVGVDAKTGAILENGAEGAKPD